MMDYNLYQLSNIFPNLSIFKAIDGYNIDIPSYWFKHDTYTKIYKDVNPIGTYGCYKSHYELLSQLQKFNRNNIIIFEDDAEFVDNFRKEYQLFISHVPDDWEVLLLGFTNNSNPKSVNNHCDKTISANTMISYIINHIGIKKYLACLDKNSKIDGMLSNEPIDCQLSRIHEKMNVYQPKKPLVIPSKLSKISNIYK